MLLYYGAKPSHAFEVISQSRTDLLLPLGEMKSSDVKWTQARRDAGKAREVRSEAEKAQYSQRRGAK